MIKVIKLNAVHYLSIHGVTFNSEKPFIEATEENLLKFHHFIENGCLKIVEVDSEGKEIVEEDDDPFNSIFSTTIEAKDIKVETVEEKIEEEKIEKAEEETEEKVEVKPKSKKKK